MTHLSIRRGALALAAAAALAAVAAPQASAKQLSCGATITKDTKLTKDLVNCHGVGIRIGAAASRSTRARPPRRSPATRSATPASPGSPPSSPRRSSSATRPTTVGGSGSARPTARSTAAATARPATGSSRNAFGWLAQADTRGRDPRQVQRRPAALRQPGTTDGPGCRNQTRPARMPDAQCGPVEFPADRPAARDWRRGICAPNPNPSVYKGGTPCASRQSAIGQSAHDVDRGSAARPIAFVPTPRRELLAVGV
jgi:hypothetical protein